MSLFREESRQTSQVQILLWPWLEGHSSTEVSFDALPLKEANISREHIYRRHSLPLRCKRCLTTFETHSGLEDHYNADQLCDKRSGRAEFDLPLGFNKDQEVLLRSRKKDPKVQTDVDRWKKVYRILFPSDPEEFIPSPCKFNSYSNSYGSPDII
jgi:hypothetical protein